MYAPGNGLCGVWGMANMLEAFLEGEVTSALRKEMFATSLGTYRFTYCFFLMPCFVRIRRND